MAGERKFDILEKLTQTGLKRIGGTNIISPLPSSLVSTQSPYSLSPSLSLSGFQRNAVFTSEMSRRSIGLTPEAPL